MLFAKKTLRKIMARLTVAAKQFLSCMRHLQLTSDQNIPITYSHSASTQIFIQARQRVKSGKLALFGCIMNNVDINA